MTYLDFISSIHKATQRNYIGRVTAHSKAQCAEVAIQYGKDYWDGERQYGYGGYQYDGRWRPMAEAIVRHYNLQPGARILDVGCGKGYLLYELSQIVQDSKVQGLDNSVYALEHAKPEIRNQLTLGSAVSLPYPDNYFDLVISITTLHNLYNFDLSKALKEIERVGRGGKYIVTESYRTEQEKVNLLYWQLTCRSFYTPDEWAWFYEQCGYSGDYGFIFFE